MQNAILTTQKLSKTFSSGGIQQHILKNLDLEIYKGDFTVIMGPSGAGKSTLMYALSGMDKPTLGEIRFSGNEIGALSNDKLAVFRRDNCGFVFQQMYLLDNMSIFDNIMACGLLVNKNRKAVAEKAKQLLKRLNLDESIWNKFSTQVSGSEAQRAAIARALINSPKIVFADEPTGALNSANGKAVLDALTEVNEQGWSDASHPARPCDQGQSVVMVTHDLKSARRGNRILYLQDGTIRGECLLGKYVTGDGERRNKLNEFLTEMGW